MIYSQKWGKGEARALLLHCSLASSDAWRGVAGHLKDHLRMTAIDFPSHGASADWDGLGDYHSHCRDAAAEALGRGMHLIGHSFGATVALRLAVEQPEMISSLTLIEPVFFAAAIGTNEFAAHEKEAAGFMAALVRGDHAVAARLFTDTWGTGAGWETLPAAMQDYLAARIWLIPELMPAMEYDNAGLLVEGRIERVGCPVLLMQGSRSPVVISQICKALEGRFSDARQVRIEGAGHMLPISHAAEVAKEIEAFLRLRNR